MDSVLAFRSPSLPLSFRPPLPRHGRIRQSPRFRLRCSPVRAEVDAPKPEHEPGPLDDLLLDFFRKKMVEEVGWDSKKPGYTGLIEVANHLMIKGKTISETEQSAVRVLQSLFPPLLLVLYKMLISPINDGKVASMMLARATAMLCQWLMGPCSVNSIELADGSSCTSGVFVERCKYLEESKCLGVCVNTCKLPTQRFFREYMGVPLYMEPNFSDYSCQSMEMELIVKLLHWGSLLKRLILGFFLHLLPVTRPSRNLVWQFAQLPPAVESLVVEISINVLKYN